MRDYGLILSGVILFAGGVLSGVGWLAGMGGAYVWRGFREVGND